MWKELVGRIQRRKKGGENISIFKTSYQFSSDFTLAVLDMKLLHGCLGFGGHFTAVLALGSLHGCPGILGSCLIPSHQLVSCLAPWLQVEFPYWI